MSSVLSGNQLSFSLPGTFQSIVATGDYMERNTGAVSVWWGEIANKGGYIGVSTQGSYQVINIQKGNETWVSYPISARYNALVEVDPETLSDDQEIIVRDSSTLPPGPTCDFESCQSTIVVSVILTPEADTTINPTGSGIGSLAGFSAAVYFSLGMQSFNLTLFNSGVVGKYVRFEYFTLPSFLYTTTIDTTFNLTSDLASIDAVADSLRALHHSDLVVMLTDDRYGPYAGAVNGRGVGIVSANNLWSPRYTFAHELGHFFGADHNRISNGGDAKDAARCNYGYHSDRGYSLMAVVNGQSRFPGFSNPNLGTGTAQDNNAGYISASMCDSQPYYSNTAEASVALAGPATVCNNQTVTYSANITAPGAGIPGAGPYTFQWRLVYKPTVTLETQGVQSGSASTFSVNTASLNLPAGQTYFWIHLTVLSNDGVRLTDMIAVEKTSCTERRIQASSALVSKKAFQISPNPGTGLFQVYTETAHAEAVPFVVVDGLGRIVKRGRIAATQQSADLELQADAGVYYVIVQTPNGTFTDKLILQH